MGETRLDTAIDADLAGPAPRAKALDVDTKGALRDIHRRVGAAVLFESSGGQVDKVAYLPELRFALGESDVETTTVDSAAAALETAGFFVRKVGSDGFRIHHQATLKKVVSDRRASLDEETEIRPAMRKLVEREFLRGPRVPVVPFPRDGAAVQDSPRLTLVVLDPEREWDDAAEAQVGQWTAARGAAPRSYPGALVWCAKKPGRELRERVETWLAWQRVATEVADGTLGTDFDQADRTHLRTMSRDAEAAAKDEVWAGYRFVALSDARGAAGLKTLDLGAGHASANETLSARVIGALKAEALLNESVGAGYLDRHWPPAHREAGAWPLAGLRQSFLDGSLTRLVDPADARDGGPDRRRAEDLVAAGRPRAARGLESARNQSPAEAPVGRRPERRHRILGTPRCRIRAKRRNGSAPDSGRPGLGRPGHPRTDVTGALASGTSPQPSHKRLPPNAGPMYSSDHGFVGLVGTNCCPASSGFPFSGNDEGEQVRRERTESRARQRGPDRIEGLFHDGGGDVGAERVDRECPLPRMYHQVHVFQWNGAHQHGVSQHERAGETRPVLEPYLKRADIRDEMGFSVRGRDLASFDSGQFELQGDVLGNAQRHGTGIDEGARLQCSDGWIPRVRETDFRANGSHPSIVSLLREISIAVSRRRAGRREAAAWQPYRPSWR